MEWYHCLHQRYRREPRASRWWTRLPLYFKGRSILQGWAVEAQSFGVRAFLLRDLQCTIPRFLRIESWAQRLLKFSTLGLKRPRWGFGFRSRYRLQQYFPMPTQPVPSHSTRSWKWWLVWKFWQRLYRLAPIHTTHLHSLRLSMSKVPQTKALQSPFSTADLIALAAY